VAVKLLKDDYRRDPDLVERFRREALAAAALSHPNIATIFDYGEDGPRLFIVMELVAGRDLGAVLREEILLGSVRAAEIAAQIADALEYAHARGIVHRDIKPGNVMIQEGDRVKVTDFGIARATGDASLTAAGSILGTVNYMSPEQARGDSIGPPSDIYSLGVVLYEMLVGAVPFTADSPVSVALQHVADEIPVPSEVNPEVSSQLDHIVRRATAKDPEARFATAAEMSAALRSPIQPSETLTSGTRLMATARLEPDVTSTQITEPVRRWPGKGASKKAYALGAAAVLLLVVVAVLSTNRHAAPAHRGGGTPSSGQAGNSHATIPSVAGLEAVTAASLLTQHHLVPQQRLIPNAAPKGTVLYTDPRAGSAVKRRSSVTLYVSSGPAPKASAPHGGHGDKEKKKKPGKHDGKGNH
jgi:eukaryotic-like serine/threonine-protein kinase